MSLSGFFITGPIPAQQLVHSYDKNLVLMSFLVAIFVSLAAIDISSKIIERKDESEEKRWLLIGAFFMGSGIWSMHFVGMMALNMEMAIVYEPAKTLLSILFAIFGTGVALRIVTKKDAIGLAGLGLSSVFLGGSIGAMHYTGMAAMKMDAIIRYRPEIFIFSLIFGVTASLMVIKILKGLQYKPEKRGTIIKALGAIAMGIAICGLHYIGMWAAVFIPSEAGALPSFALTEDMLVTFIIFLVVIVLSAYYYDLALSHLSLKESKDMAEKANEAKSSFLSNMSHELRTPMNGILGFAQLLELNPKEKLSENQADKVKEIIKSGNYLLDLINEVLDLSRIESGHMTVSIEPIEMETIMGDCINIIRPIAEKRNITLNFDPSCCGQYCVRADLTRTRQVLLNIMSNGIKYNREGGILTVRCEKRDDWLDVTIADTGKGLSPAQLKTLFNPFERFDAENSGIEGTGIGLTITKRLMELMEGEIKVESEEGKGMTFTISFMLDKVRVATSEEKAEPFGPGIIREAEDTGKRYRVLYVEDNPPNLRLMQDIFSTIDDVHLDTAHTPELGLELAFANPPDLFLLDINLPGMSGFKVLEILRESEQTKGIPAVAVSANAMPSDIKKGMKAGFDDYITKPIDIPKLMESVNNFLDRSA